VEIHRSARKHGLSDDNITQAATHYLIAYPSMTTSPHENCVSASTAPDVS
jgi:hypothetical protein